MAVLSISGNLSRGEPWVYLIVRGFMVELFKILYAHIFMIKSQNLNFGGKAEILCKIVIRCFCSGVGE